MRLNLNREWFARRAELEGDLEVAAGLSTADALIAETARARREGRSEGTLLAFARLINLKRRERRLTLEALAEQADIDLEELCAIERGELSDPPPRTVYKLAEVLHLPPGKLMQLSGLTEARDEEFCREAVRFHARSQPVERLSREEEKALQEFVKYLSEG